MKPKCFAFTPVGTKSFTGNGPNVRQRDVRASHVRHTGSDSIGGTFLHTRNTHFKACSSAKSIGITSTMFFSVYGLLRTDITALTSHITDVIYLDKRWSRGHPASTRNCTQKRYGCMWVGRYVTD